MYALDYIRTTDDLIRCADDAGSYFFSPGAMQAFNSRVLSGIYAVDTFEAKAGNRFYFVTSERYEDQPREYKVRYANLYTDSNGRSKMDIGTAGDDVFPSARAAHKAADAMWRDSRTA